MNQDYKTIDPWISHVLQKWIHYSIAIQGDAVVLVQEKLKWSRVSDIWPPLSARKGQVHL